MNTRKKTQIAIACQGGGSHAAFTAGVLRRFLQSDVSSRYEIVSLSGTSGGGLCALLAWYGLLKNSQSEAAAPDRELIDFWQDNSATQLWEQYLNYLLVQSCRFYEKGIIPSYASNPYLWGGMQQIWQTLTPRREYLDLKKLIEKHINFEALPDLIRTASPRLFLGAVNVRSGDSKIFDSQRGEIKIDAILASAAIPNLFKAVEIGDAAYWDGLFAENPPVLPLADPDLIPPSRWPEELWVIRVNPRTCDDIPRTAPDISARRDQLSGNLSLHHTLQFIERTNRWLRQGILNGRRAGIAPVEIRQLEIDPSHIQGLDFASKFDRDPDLIGHLLDAGFRQAETFLDTLSAAYPDFASNPPPPSPQLDPGVLWQIGSPPGRLNFPQPGIWTPEYHYQVGTDADPVNNPSLPKILTAPDAHKPPGVASTDRLNVHFHLTRDYGEGELTLFYNRDGVQEDRIFLDDVLLIRIWGATEGGTRQSQLRLGPLAAGEHTLTLIAVGGSGGHRIYELKLEVGVALPDRVEAEPWISTRAPEEPEPEIEANLEPEIEAASVSPPPPETPAVIGSDRPCATGRATDRVDLIVVIDTGAALRQEARELSDIAETAIAEIQTAAPCDLRVTWLGVGGTWARTRFDHTVRDYLIRECRVPPAEIRSRHRGSPADGDTRSDVARTLLDLCDRFNWRMGATRGIFYLGDGTRSGGEFRGEEDDIEAVSIAIQTAKAAGVAVYTYLGTAPVGDEEGIAADYGRLAAETGGRSFVDRNVDGRYYALLRDVILATRRVDRVAELPESLPGLAFRASLPPDSQTLSLQATNREINATIADLAVVDVEVTTVDAERQAILPAGEALVLGDLPAADTEPATATAEFVPDESWDGTDLTTARLRYTCQVSVNFRGRDRFKFTISEGE
ncbi:MAG: patatin-like phospholipase family protein [Limnospira sp.]